jgi:flagellar export protein FliJ
MNSFRFRGARLLEWRRAQADAARLAFVRANASARETADLLAAADAGCERAVREYLAVIAAPVDVATLERYRNWIDRQRSRLATARRAHVERREVAAAAAAALHTANRHVKVMERLRERAERRHLDAERRFEMKTLDELATLQYARRQGEGGADREY